MPRAGGIITWGGTEFLKEGRKRWARKGKEMRPRSQSSARAEALVMVLRGLGRLARASRGSPSPSSRPPAPPASAIRASLAASEPSIDAGPRVSQDCVTAPRRQGGLAESEGTVRGALRPDPFRSAEPARPERREGGIRPRCPQPHALPLPRDLGPRAAPQRPERTAGGSWAGNRGEGGSEERAESRARASGSGSPPSPGR